MNTADLKRLVSSQALDEGLWFTAQTAPEAYLQEALRKLHGAVEALDDWISVDDRLPEIYQKVLIWTTDADGDYITWIAHWNGEDTGFLIDSGRRDNDVTHWQPLPEPSTKPERR